MIIGIDPGAKGALAILYPNQDLEIIRFSKLSLFEGGPIDRRLAELPLYDTNVYMEKVHGMPWDTPTTAFSFGRNVGLIEAVIKMQGGSIKYVTPQQWQKDLHLKNVKVDYRSQASPRALKAARKKAYVDYAKKMFPKYEGLITLETADAVLIAEYGYRQVNGVSPNEL